LPSFTLLKRPDWISQMPTAIPPATSAKKDSQKIQQKQARRERFFC